MQTLEELACQTRNVLLKATLSPELAAARLAPVMVTTAREIIGTHVLRDLMESTQQERVRLKFTPNDPLKRTSKFQDTIVGVAEGPLAVTGTDDERGEWFEMGTAHMQPFANFAITLDAVLPEAALIAEEVARESVEG